MDLLKAIELERDRLHKRVLALTAAANALRAAGDTAPEPAERKPRKQRAEKKPPNVKRTAKPRGKETRRLKVVKKPRVKAQPAGEGQELTYQEAAKHFPYTPNSISQLKVTKKVTGGRGTVHVASLRAYHEAQQHRKQQPKPRAAAPRKKPERNTYRMKPREDGERPWLNGESAPGDMKPWDWIADKLHMFEEQVQEIVKAGGIQSGTHVANWKQLQAYMAHPSYVAPEPVEA